MTSDGSGPSGPPGSGSGRLPRAPLTQLGSIQITGEVGRGGMGVVYRGFDQAVQRPVAVKLLLAGAGAAQAQRERFQRELRLLGQLRHPQLLAIFGSGEVKGVPYMVTEWLEGITLQARVDQHGALSPGEAAQVMASLARGVAYAHELGVLHRDIKPENVILEPRRGPVLLDFGLAKESDPEAERLTRSGSFAGTAAYAAPEQMIDAAKVDARADVYSLGATLYFLLTGESPSAGVETLAALLAAAAGGHLPRVRERAPSAPRQLDALVAQAMAGRKEERLASAAEFARELELFLDPTARSPARAPARFGLPLALLAGLGALGGAYALGRSGRAPSAPAPASPSPSPSDAPRATPSPSPGALVGAEASEWVAAAERAREELQRFVETSGVEGPTDLATWQGRARELDRLLQAYEALVPRQGGPAADLARGVALADRGRWGEALALLAESSAPRARLSWASASVSAALGADEEPRRALPVLRLAASSEDTGASALALIWIEVLESERADAAAVRGWIARAAEAGGVPEADPWLNREAWFVALYALGRLGDPVLRAQLNRDLTPLEQRHRPPLYSHAFAELLLASWDRARLAEVQLAVLELLMTHAPSRGGVRQLAKLYAVGGFLGALRRLDDLQSGADLRPMRRVAAQVATSRSAPALSSSVVSGPYLTLTLRPDQSAVRVLWEFPPGPWTLRVRGAEVDCDLFVRHDAPPARDDPRTQRAMTMAREESLSSLPNRPTSGFHQVLVERGIPWSEPLRLTLELSAGDEWTSPWEVQAETEGVDVSELAEVRRLSQAGRLKEALAFLAPLEARSPELILVHASLLANAARWPELRRLGASAKGLRPRVRRALGFEEALAAANEGELAVAASRLGYLLSKDPRCLLAWEELAMAQAAVGELGSAEASIRRILARDPHQPAAQTLAEALARLSAQGGGPGPRERERFERHARARTLLTRLLLPQRPQEALDLLETLPGRSPREEVWRAEALGRLDRQAEARSALQALDEGDLAGPTRAARARLLHQLESGR